MTQAFLNIRLDKDIPVPLYYQLKRQLLEMIEQNILNDGDPFPPENELSEQLGVSRPTVRQALGELVNEGYLHRYKGRGTFVARPKVEDRFLSRLESFDKEMLQKGLKPHTRVLGVEEARSGQACERLRLPGEAPLIQLRRLRFADGVPLVYVETYLSRAKYGALLEVDFEQTSLYDALEQLCHTRVSRVCREVEAVNARRQEAELLEIPPNHAIFLVKTRAYAADPENPVEYSVARYRGDLNKFSVEIQR